MAVSTFPCSSCGADLAFEPGTTSLACPYCKAVNEIAPAAGAVEELDFIQAIAQLDEAAEHVEVIEVTCQTCSAHVRLEENTASRACPFCGSNIVASGVSARVIKPKSVLPFSVTRAKAQQAFRAWIGSRWFAPSALKRLATIEGDAKYKGANASPLAGLYMPYWTYDCHATTRYTGMRGDHYYVSVPRTSTVNGKQVTRMVQERRTRWTPAAGVVIDAFNDVLVVGSDALPSEQLAGVEDWDLGALTPYKDEYLSGFRAQTYSVDLRGGFDGAKVKMQPAIEATIRADIGGDVQTITSKTSSYLGITFKHILVPVWVSAYRYNGKAYRFLVNGRSGSVSGSRPYSAWKITFFTLACLTVAGLIAWYVSRA
ncbi:MAG: zinc finger domain-containing protein [Phycisphaerales bacterium]